MARAKRGVYKKIPGNVCEWNGNKFRSEFELNFAKELEEQGVKWEYEPDKFEWYPEPRYYTPDFKITRPDGSVFYIETKGFFTASARTKMERVHAIHPDVDIRYLFMRASNKLSAKAKKRPTTYAMWCERRKLPWAEKSLPEEWLRNGKGTK